MTIVTAREFRANQRKYFDLAQKETVVVTRRGAASVCISSQIPENVFIPVDIDAL